VNHLSSNIILKWDHHHLLEYSLEGGEKNGIPPSTIFLAPMVPFGYGAIVGRWRESMKPGDLVVNGSPGSSAMLFSLPMGKVDYLGQRRHLGYLSGIGVVIDVHRSDVKLMCGDVVGWCYVGNVKVISEDR